MQRKQSERGGIGGCSGARLPPFLRNIVIAAFPRRLGVTIIIEVEQDDREMRQLSHYSFDGGYHERDGSMVTDMPLSIRLNISEFSSVFSPRCMVMFLFESSRSLSLYLKWNIVNNCCNHLFITFYVLYTILLLKRDSTLRSKTVLRRNDWTIQSRDKSFYTFKDCFSIKYTPPSTFPLFFSSLCGR